MQFLETLFIILLATLIGGQLSSRLNLPAVIGELLAGVIVGPAVLNIVQPNDMIKIFSDLGVILLMFLAGLESDLKILVKLLRPSFLVAVCGMVIPIIVAYATGIFFQFSQLESIFLGLTFAATSVSISVAVLQEMGRLNSKEGLTILGAAVVDDLLSILLLSVATSMIGATTAKNSAGLKLILAIFLQILYLFLLAFISVKIIPRLFKLSQKITLPASETLIAMIVIILSAWGAEMVGLSNVIGAFFTGLALSKTQAQKSLKQNFTAIGYSSFIPVFFISIGLEMSIKSIANDFLLFLLLTVGSILSKLIGAGLGAKIAGFTSSNAFLVGTGMVSRGEMALVVAQIGLSNHLLAPSAYSTVIGAIIMTTVLSPFLLKWAISHSK